MANTDTAPDTLPEVIPIPAPELGEKESNPGDYLVVERQPGKQPVYHLPVKSGGKPNHRLMGGAWAALHGGYRGQKYQGPDKAGALKRLMALYHSEKMPLPDSSKEREERLAQDVSADPVAEALWQKYYSDAVPVRIVENDSEHSCGPVSFKELEALRTAQDAAWDLERLALDFRQLTDNILNMDGETLDKATALNALAVEFAALAAARPKTKSVLERAKAAVQGWMQPKPDPAPAVVKEQESGFLVYKDTADGTLRWLGVFSNKFRDRDNPPEIIAAAAHQEFAEAVQKGLWPAPELRLWHLPGAVIGQADTIAWDSAGFQVAAGHICKGMEPVAQLMQAAPIRWSMSHGMPPAEIRREDPTDPTVLTRYRSKEITALPDWAAANELTVYLPAVGTSQGLEGGPSMAFDAKAREKLEQMFGKDKVSEVEQLLQVQAQAAAASGLDSKEKSEPAAPVITLVEATPVPPAAMAPVPVKPVVPAAAPSEAEQVLAQVKELSTGLTTALAALTTKMQELEQKVDTAQQTAQAAVLEELRQTPAAAQASLTDLMGLSFSRGKQTAAQIKGRATGDLAGPVENKDEQSAETGGVGRIPFLRNLLNPTAPPPAE